MPLETPPDDTAEHLRTDEDVALYIEAVLEDGDPALIRDAIGIVARARGMSRIARETGLSRESLHKALSQTGNPSFETVRAVLQALGLQLGMTRADKPAA
ncbi:addiction module antidote protein [Methylobacterium platani]|uniref:Addiction module antitoxin n=2 Tax=Methylobacterium platani TaxID=427683 RepID=A0A179S936_9HYPH|nr:addiction module antidote protein [Methylobacterium platani]KMO11350.1 addiction module antitoxin [Methylobacterium platani JCM 14648]OAS22314.1 addiction module antitoxin [Methylobacterium platani]